MAPLVSRALSYGLRHRAGKWLILGGLVGLMTGAVGFLFYAASDLGFSLLMHGVVGWDFQAPTGEVPLMAAAEGHPPAAAFSGWLLLLVLTAGGLISGLLAARLAREAAGAGTGVVVDAFHNRAGDVSLRTTITKFFATIATYVTGGSAGREGPVSLLGAGLASVVGRRLQLSSRERRILLCAGVAGGVAALFRAPLAAAFFACEVLYRDADVESEALIPSFISAIVAYCVFGVLFTACLPGDLGSDSFLPAMFSTPDLRFGIASIGELLPLLILALLLAGACRLMTLLYSGTGTWFHAGRLPFWLRPAVGACGAGLVALLLLWLVRRVGLVPAGDESVLAVLGTGYGILQWAFDGAGSWTAGTIALLLLIVAAGKMVTTSLTVGSGGSGGVFGPSVCIGGSLGGAVGFALQAVPALSPIAPHPATCIVMGMAGFLAAGYKTPVAALLMIAELTGSYSLLIPGMWVCALAYLMSGRAGLMSGQVDSPIDSPAHQGHFFSDILAGIRVVQVFDGERPVRTVAPDSDLDACKQLVTETHQNVYPVVAEDGRLVGIFSLNDLRSFLFDESLGLIAVAEDVATKEIISLELKDSLATALRRFTQKNLEELPVLAADGHFLGLLSRRQVITRYNEVVDELRARKRADGY